MYCIMEQGKQIDACSWQKLKKKLLVPSPTRWSSYFDVICRVVENLLSDINEVCCSIELHGFSEKDLRFLQEYVIALRPLFRGLDILQGEGYCNYSTLFPTLETICTKKPRPLFQSYQLWQLVLLMPLILQGVIYKHLLFQRCHHCRSNIPKI